MTNANMFKEAKSGDDVDVYLEGTASMLGDLRGLVSLKVNEHPIVKSVANQSCLNGVHMIDLKLNV